MKTHTKFRNLINLKLDGRLPVEAEQRLEAHLRNCEACRKEYEHLAAIRRHLLSVADIPLDPVAAEKRKSRIMAAVSARSKAIRGMRSKRSLLRPAVVFACLVVISVISITLLHDGRPQGPVLFSNPQDTIIDTMLVNTLNEHELTGIFEVYNEPPVIAAEVGVNGDRMIEKLK